MARILTITGASGIVGRTLIRKAKADGWEIRVLTRNPDKPRKDGAQAFGWNPGAGYTASVADAIRGADAVVNLAGAGVADGRFSHAHKQRILQSRLDSAEMLNIAFEHFFALF